ncbi:MAG: hypothetical protein HKM24_01510 [Gammaproteobacteria bacterium]|nr:hypothetical protein [Gammaproteobacteria bacterium]
MNKQNIMNIVSRIAGAGRPVSLLLVAMLAACATNKPAQTVDITDCMVDRCAFEESGHCRGVALSASTDNTCGELRQCIEHVFGADGEQAMSCGKPRIVRIPRASQKLTQTQAIAAVDVSYVDGEGLPSHSALLLQHASPVTIHASTQKKRSTPANDWQVIDQLLEPSWTHGGGCESDFAVQSVSNQDNDVFEMVVSTQRVCHQPLDTEEFIAGEPDVAFAECKHRHYRLADEGLTLVTWSTSDTCISYH